MKTALIYLALLFTLSAFGQTEWRLPEPEKKPYNLKRGLLCGSLGFIAGAAYGVHETSVYKPHNFPESYNPQWWDNDLSWRNKYKNGNPHEGPRFWGSTKYFVATTDAKHLFGSIHRFAMIGTGITIAFGEKRSWKHYALDAMFAGLGHGIGFWATYEANLYPEFK